VLPPASYELEAWVGEAWRPVPDQHRSPEEPTGRRANTIGFPEQVTSRIRVVLHHAPGATSGLSELEAWGPGELPLPVASAAVENLAWNPGDRPLPRASASFTGPSDDVAQAVDGRLSFTRYSRNRWTAYRTPNLQDWLEVDFGQPREVGRVEIFLFGDGRGVAAPMDYRIEEWNGEAWVEAPVRARSPEEPLAWALNTVVVGPVTTERVRVVFTHAPPAVAGVTELRIWPR